jgi:hypothetical protein
MAEHAGLREAARLEVVFAILFNRPTPLEGAERLRNRVRMFAGESLAAVPEEQQEVFFECVEKQVRGELGSGLSTLARRCAQA